jgi:cation transport regulator ChaC
MTYFAIYMKKMLEQDEEIVYIQVKTVSKKKKETTCSMSDERNEFGVPQHQDECIACTYVEESETSGISYEKLLNLLDLMREDVAKDDIFILVESIAKQYAELREMANSDLLAGEKSLPD